jgi:glyoxylate/hydroxypyruvate reductase
LPPSHQDAPRVIYTSSRKRDNQEEIDGDYSRRFGVNVQWVDKDGLASQSDVLVVLCNLNESTKGIVGAEFLSKMKDTSVLVNAARVSGSDLHY